MNLRSEQVDSWPLAEAGLPRRVRRALLRAGITTVGELRKRSGAAIPGCGVTARRQIAQFLERTEHCAGGIELPSDLRSWLAQFLGAAEQAVVEQRYGLEDPLFRPLMKRRTFREIAEARGGLSRQRVGQILQRALEKLRSRLARAMSQNLFAAVAQHLEKSGGIVTSTELGAWQGMPWLGGYQPWGAMLLLAETGTELTFRHDYFAIRPVAELEKMEGQLLAVLEGADRPLSPAEIAPHLPVRVATVLLDRHPAVDATRDGSFFLFPHGAKPLLAAVAALPLEEATARYNEQVAAHSRRNPSELSAFTGNQTGAPSGRRRRKGKPRPS